MSKIFQNNFAIFFAILVSLFSETISAQYTIPDKPSQQTSVYDYVNLLTPNEKAALTSKLIRYADSTSTQIVCVIIGSTKGEDISLLGAQWGQKWGIGQADEDNGILITLAKDDRKVDINTGYGIEYRITDLMSERIINRVMIPQFKTGNYYAGLDQGSDAIFSALKGEFKEERDFSNTDGKFNIGILMFIIIVIIMIFKNRKGGKGGRGGGLMEAIILSSLGRTGGFGGSGGGSFGGGGGGGFGGGFGGGGFGGGGASGGW